MSQTRIEEHWKKISSLVEDAQNPEVKRILKYGTPQEKLEKLRGHDLTMEVLEELHEELETIVYKGSIPWWWW